MNAGVLGDANAVDDNVGELLRAPGKCGIEGFGPQHELAVEDVIADFTLLTT